MFVQSQRNYTLNTQHHRMLAPLHDLIILTDFPGIFERNGRLTVHAPYAPRNEYAHCYRALVYAQNSPWLRQTCAPCIRTLARTINATTRVVFVTPSTRYGGVKHLPEVHDWRAYSRWAPILPELLIYRALSSSLFTRTLYSKICLRRNV